MCQATTPLKFKPNYPLNGHTILIEMQRGCVAGHLVKFANVSTASYGGYMRSRRSLTARYGVANAHYVGYGKPPGALYKTLSDVYPLVGDFRTAATIPAILVGGSGRISIIRRSVCRISTFMCLCIRSSCHCSRCLVNRNRSAGL